MTLRDLLCASTLLTVACASGDGGGSLGKLLDSFKGKVKDNAVGQVLGAGADAAKDAVKDAPAVKVGAAALPAAATGGVDTGKAVDGKSGTTSQDMDGDGKAETVSVFVTEPAEGGTSTTYASWEADGYCYLAWKVGDIEYIQFSECGDKSGAIVCNGTETDFDCQACTAAGQCQACDPADLSTCSWTSGGGDGNDSSDGEDGSEASDGSDSSERTDASDGNDALDGDDGDDGSDASDGAADSADADDGSDGSDGGSGGLNCVELNDCVISCEGDEGCLSGCEAQASATALDLFWQLFECVNSSCENPPESCEACSFEEQACVEDQGGS